MDEMQKLRGIFKRSTHLNELKRIKQNYAKEREKKIWYTAFYQ